MQADLAKFKRYLETRYPDRSTPKHYMSDLAIFHQFVRLGRHLPRDVSDAVVAQLLAVVDHPRDRAMLALMSGAGLRVQGGKGDRDRVIPMTEHLGRRTPGLSGRHSYGSNRSGCRGRLARPDCRFNPIHFYIDHQNLQLSVMGNNTVAVIEPGLRRPAPILRRSGTDFCSATRYPASGAVCPSR